MSIPYAGGGPGDANADSATALSSGQTPKALHTGMKHLVALRPWAEIPELAYPGRLSFRICFAGFFYATLGRVQAYLNTFFLPVGSVPQTLRNGRPPASSIYDFVLESI